MQKPNRGTPEVALASSWCSIFIDAPARPQAAQSFRRIATQLIDLARLLRCVALAFELLIYKRDGCVGNANDGLLSFLTW